MHALVPSVLLRLAGSDPLRLNPGLDHENRKPGQPSDAGGGERRTVVGAKPERQAEFAEGGVKHRPDVLGVAPGQRLTAQQIAAVRVGERQRFATAPSPVTNQPLKSMHQTSLAAPQWPNGALEGGLRRRSLRFTVRPSRSNKRPIVLAAGQSIEGACRSRKARTFKGPQVGCALRTATHRSPISRAIACG